MQKWSETLHVFWHEFSDINWCQKAWIDSDISFTQLLREGLPSKSHIQEIKKNNIEYMNSNPSCENRFPLWPRTGLWFLCSWTSCDERRCMVEIPKPMYLLGFFAFHDHPTCTVRAYLKMFQLLHTSFMIHNCTCYLASLLHWYDMDSGVHGRMDVHKGKMRALNL